MNKNENEQTLSAEAEEQVQQTRGKGKLAEMLEALGHIAQEPILVTQEGLDAMNDYEFESYLSLLAEELPARKQARSPLNIVRAKISFILSRENMGEIEREELISSIVENFMETDEYYKHRLMDVHAFVGRFAVMREGEKITPSFNRRG